MAAAGMHALGSEIEAALAQQASGGIEEGYFQHRAGRAVLRQVCGVGVTGLRQKVLLRGRIGRPIRFGKGGRRRFTVPMLRAMAWSAYRRGT